jgi:hypothetical protein
MTRQWRQAPPFCPPAKRSTPATTATILLASIVGLSLLTAALLALSNLDHHPGPILSVGILSPRSGEEPAATESTRIYPEPKRSDFTLKVKERKRQKFGPAGANITYHIVAGWRPTYDPAKTYALVYEVHGGEDGPVRNYIKIRGDTSRPRTPSSSRPRTSTSGSPSRPSRWRSWPGPCSPLAPASPNK